jgi:Domain of unknown function (DUF5666)
MEKFKRSLLFSFLPLFAMATLRAQDPAAPPPPPQDRPAQGHGGQEGGPRPLFGKISAIHNGSMEITGPDGQTVIVKTTDQTQYRKDREQAAATDFKVGDTVMVRGDVNADHTVTAKAIGARSGGPGGGPGAMGGGARGGPAGGPVGTLGKDYIVGEVKAIDPPHITVLRTDNVVQTIELNENTSLRKGRDSITMAEIQVGDHLMARGALENNVFVPKGVNVVNPEQWKRMQEMRNANGGAASPAPPTTPPPAAAPPSKPAEPPN